MNYDLVVIGSGREAVDAAIIGGRRGERVALAKPVEERWQATPKLLRAAVDRWPATAAVSMKDLRQTVDVQIKTQQAADLVELRQLGVDVLAGSTRFIDTRSLMIGSAMVMADRIVLAMGTRSIALRQAPFDGTRVLAVEDLLSLDKLPDSMIVVGAGYTGLESAILLARMNVNVTVVDEQSDHFELCGGLMDMTLVEAQSLDIAFRLGDEVLGIERRANGLTVAVRLGSGRVLSADAALVCIGREGRTDGLELELAGVGLDEHGRIWCDGQGQTWTPGITAIGDVVGFRASAMAS